MTTLIKMNTNWSINLAVNIIIDVVGIIIIKTIGLINETLYIYGTVKSQSK